MMRNCGPNGSEPEKSERETQRELLGARGHKMSPRRGCDFPTCPVCAELILAAVASAYVHDNTINYLWACDTCGYSFVSGHSVNSTSVTVT